MNEESGQELRGSCSCGAVTYRASAAPRVTVACHCSLCRKLTGSAFGVWALVPKTAFAWTQGESEITEHASSEHGRRLFCRRCGSTLGSLTSRRPTFMHLAAGTLDGAPALKLSMHLYVASKAPWFEIEGALPQFAAEPPPRGA
jgi:hypothetical protein